MGLENQAGGYLIPSLTIAAIGISFPKFFSFVNIVMISLEELDFRLSSDEIIHERRETMVKIEIEPNVKRRILQSDTEFNYSTKFSFFL